ncbi:MAG: YggU family protein [Bdellovibrionales bacterium]|nr:YggU family protein [Bdellovibrionales bacterium]
MIIRVQVKPNSKKESIVLHEDGYYIVRVNAPAVEGKANKRVIEILSKYFKISKTRVILNKGEKSKIKQFLIQL